MKPIRSLLVLALLNVAFLGSASAATIPTSVAPSFTLTSTASVVSAYVFRGVKLADTSLQPSVELNAGAVTLGVWSSLPVNDKTVNPEIDFYGSASSPITKDLSLVGSATYYRYPQSTKGEHRGTLEPSVGLSYSLGNLSLAPRAYYDLDQRAFTYELGLTYAVPVKVLHVTPTLAATAGTFKARDIDTDSPATKAWGNYWSAGLSLPFDLSKRSKLTFGWLYTGTGAAYVKTGRKPQLDNNGPKRGVGSLAYSLAL